MNVGGFERLQFTTFDVGGQYSHGSYSELIDNCLGLDLNQKYINAEKETIKQIPKWGSFIMLQHIGDTTRPLFKALQEFYHLFYHQLDNPVRTLVGISKLIHPNEPTDVSFSFRFFWSTCSENVNESECEEAHVAAVKGKLLNGKDFVAMSIALPKYSLTHSIKKEEIEAKQRGDAYLKGLAEKIKEAFSDVSFCSIGIGGGLPYVSNQSGYQPLRCAGFYIFHTDEPTHKDTSPHEVQMRLQKRDIIAIRSDQICSRKFDRAGMRKGEYGINIVKIKPLINIDNPAVHEQHMSSHSPVQLKIDFFYSLNKIRANITKINYYTEKSCNKNTPPDTKKKIIRLLNYIFAPEEWILKCTEWQLDRFIASKNDQSTPHSAFSKIFKPPITDKQALMLRERLLNAMRKLENKSVASDQLFKMYILNQCNRQFNPLTGAILVHNKGHLELRPTLPHDQLDDVSLLTDPPDNKTLKKDINLYTLSLFQDDKRNKILEKGISKQINKKIEYLKKYYSKSFQAIQLTREPPFYPNGLKFNAKGVPFSGLSLDVCSTYIFFEEFSTLFLFGLNYDQDVIRNISSNIKNIAQLRCFKEYFTTLLYYYFVEVITATLNDGAKLTVTINDLYIGIIERLIQARNYTKNQDLHCSLTMIMKIIDPTHFQEGNSDYIIVHYGQDLIFYTSSKNTNNPNISLIESSPSKSDQSQDPKEVSTIPPDLVPETFIISDSTKIGFNATTGHLRGTRVSLPNDSTLYVASERLAEGLTLEAISEILIPMLAKSKDIEEEARSFLEVQKILKKDKSYMNTLIGGASLMKMTAKTPGVSL